MLANRSASNVDCECMLTSIALCRIENLVYPKPAPPEYPIQVNEVRQTVTAQAGVPQRILLDYLANYT